MTIGWLEKTLNIFNNINKTRIVWFNLSLRQILRIGEIEISNYLLIICIYKAIHKLL